MNKNLIPEIAHLLGVEIGEEFEVFKAETGVVAKNKIRILDKKIVACSSDDVLGVWRTLDADDLNRIFNGELVIKRKPWKPKLNERYWTYGGKEFYIADCNWQNDTYDCASLKCGMVFRTKEEAVQSRPRIYKELTGMDWQED